jgi:hypothetical protein
MVDRCDESRVGLAAIPEKIHVCAEDVSSELLGTAWVYKQLSQEAGFLRAPAIQQSGKIQGMKR